MEFRILGPLEVVDQGRRLPLGAPKQRALLAALLLRANEIVSADRLIDDLWNDRPPDTAAKVVQVYVSQLRKSLGEDDRLLTRSPGYLLRVDAHELDAQRFELLFEEGRRALAAGDAREAATTIREALALWRGPPLADLAFEPFTQSEIARLEERKLAATIERIDADLALGRHADLIAELETLVADHPLQERLRAQLMLALYRSGRQAEALQTYQSGRLVLSGELGLEPGQALQNLERAILTHDPALDPPQHELDVAAQAPRPSEDLSDRCVTFPELVWEHFRWARERRSSGAASPVTEASYRRKLADFEATEGKIVNAYWCQHEASAAALTVRATSFLRRLVGVQPTVRVHRVSDWIARDAPVVAELLVRCDALAIEAGDALRGTGRRRALERIFSAETHLLGLLERTAGRPSEAQTEEAARQTRDLLTPVEAALPGRAERRRLAR
jgi:DNA-binding SARP family transcriptional activator